MSAMGGVYYFDNQPVDRGLLASMGDKLSCHGPDGGSEIVSDSIGIVYRAFHTNRESRLEKQPLVSREGQILAWDGRLDNRDEMISLLRQELNGDRTDVAIVMAAYLKFGADFLPRLIGDFALSLWEPRERTLLLARDAVGPRTLYYHANKSRIIWSTELGVLLDLVGVELEINDEYIADFLTRLPDPAQTPYKNIHAAPPGNVVTTCNGLVQIQRFWGLDPKRQIRYKTDAEYEEHFLHLFSEAVCCRLRTDGPVWAELSGGLDSSSIVCMADQLIKSGEAMAHTLQTVSFVFDEAAKSDERKYIRLVEEVTGRKGLHLREDDFRILTPLRDGCSVTIPSTVANFAEYYRVLDDAMCERGARILLSGKGGDSILIRSRNPAPELADLLAKGRLLQLHYRLQEWNNYLKKSYLRLLFENGAAPLLPNRLRFLLASKSKFDFLNLYNHEFARRLDMRARVFDSTDIFGFSHHSGRVSAISFLRLVRELSAGYWRNFSRAEICYPYTHRPLVEFLVAIPFEQKVRPGETRSLLRRALRDLLPTEIVERKGKTLNTEAALKAVNREYPRLRKMLKDARVCAYGYVDSKALSATIDLAESGADLRSLSIAPIIPLEYWLQSFDRQSLKSPKL